jgi:two-component system OmpR family response regulator
VPGIIEASRGEVVKKVYIKGGTVVHASSTDLDDSLGSYLLRNRRLTPDQFRTSMRERRNSSDRFGVLLIKLGFLSPADVYDAIREQIESIVWSLFAWRDGVVTFAIGEYQPAGTVSIQIPMRQVILRGIRRAPDAKPLVARLGSKETVFEPAYHVESLIESSLDAEAYELLCGVDGERTLYEICKIGPYSVAENAKLMYAFQVMQLIRKAVPSAGAEGKSGSGGAESSGETDRERLREGDKRSSGHSSGAIKIRLDTRGGRFGK